MFFVFIVPVMQCVIISSGKIISLARYYLESNVLELVLYVCLFAQKITIIQLLLLSCMLTLQIVFGCERKFMRLLHKVFVYVCLTIIIHAYKTCIYCCKYIYMCSMW